MKVSYRREIKHNYMIIDPEELIWRNYESQMLESNVIEGLLRFQLRQNNGETRFYYEITSRQPLGRLLENRTISGEEIRRLVIGISNVLDQVERFLLREGSILLKPEYIYVEPDSFRIWLCLVPGLNLDFPEAYGKLLEYILEKADHQDKDSVVLAYGLYQETRKENYGMEDILRLLQEPPIPAPDRKEEREDAAGGVRISAMRQEAGTSRYAPPYPQGNQTSRKSASPDHISPKHKSLWAHVKAWFLRWKKETTEEESVQLLWQTMFMEEEVEKCSVAVPETEGTPFRRELPSFQETVLPPTDFTPNGQGTVLLSEIMKQETVHILRALDSGGEDIPISYYPFIIGKQVNLADYILNHETVSRLHVRIDRAGEEYRVTDLNSTNGTLVRGVLLENNETVFLYPGDELQIARHRYRFE